MERVNPDNGLIPPVKTRLLFLLFQRVRDQLYLTPPRVTEHDDWLGVYLGALGFTKPLEQLMLHTVPQQSPLDWLFEPQGGDFSDSGTLQGPGHSSHQEDTI